MCHDFFVLLDVAHCNEARPTLDAEIRLAGMADVLAEIPHRFMWLYFGLMVDGDRVIGGRICYRTEGDEHELAFFKIFLSEQALTVATGIPRIDIVFNTVHIIQREPNLSPDLRPCSCTGCVSQGRKKNFQSGFADSSTSEGSFVPSRLLYGVVCPDST